MAVAADLPSRMAPVLAPPPPVFTWSGFYVGGNAGGTFTNRNSVAVAGAPIFTTDPTNVFAGVATNNAIATGVTGISNFGTRKGAILGVQAGYNYQFASPVLIGVEADIQGIIQSGQRTAYAAFTPIAGFPGFTDDTSVVVTKRLDYLGTVRARLGYAFSPSFLVYATGGLAYGQVKSQTASAVAPVGTILGAAAVAGINKGKIGYAIGGGGEWMFLPNWSLKAEYLYYDLGSVTYGAGVLATPTAVAAFNPFNVVAERTRLRYDGHVARLGVNYHFWGPPAAPVVARY